MEILSTVEIIGKSLYLRDHDVLLATDFHMGYEESLIKKGAMIPKTMYKDIVKSLDEIFKKVKPKIFVIPGDLKHEFGRILKQEWKDTLKLLDYLSKKVKEIIIIKGNHDKVLEPLAKKAGVKVVNEYLVGDFLIIHGDKEPTIPKGVKTIIMGHEHPAVYLTEGRRREKFKCFIKGKYKRKNLIVMPSFNPLTTGTDVISNPLLSPLLDKGVSKFEVYVVGKETLYFGKVRDIEE